MNNKELSLKNMEKITEMIQKDFTYGNLYSGLNQLLKKRFVHKRVGDPTPERRGRPKIFYTVTNEGAAALKKAKEQNETVWSYYSDLAF